MSKSLKGSIEKLIVNVADGKIVSDEMTKVLADAQELEEAAEALCRAATLAGANVRLGRIRTILSKIQGR